jgi:hypothetical protein
VLCIYSVGDTGVVGVVPKKMACGAEMLRVMNVNFLVVML